MRSVRGVTALLVAACMGSCVAADAPRVGTPISIEALHPILVVGLDDRDSLASFTRIQDAAFVGDSLAVLDVSPPFLRIFDENGRFVSSLVREGKGPGEAKRPSGVAAFGSGYLIAEIGRVNYIDTAGRLVSALAMPGQRVRGVTAGCQDQVLLLTTPVTMVDGPGAILRYRPGVEALDTVFALDSVRANSRHVHPLFAAASSDVVSMYPEDVHRGRLLRYHCDGSGVTELPIDSLGRQEWWEPNGSGGYLLHPPEAPWPAGVADLGGAVMWAAQEVRRRGVAEDSITRIVTYASGGGETTLELAGWYQILDVSTTGRVLLRSEYPVDHVTVVHSVSLTEAIRKGR